MHYDSCGAFPNGGAVVRVPVQNQISTVAIDHFDETGGPQITKDFGTLSDDCVLHRSIVQHNHSFGSAQLRHGTLQFHSFVHGGFHEGFDFRFAECSQCGASEASDEPLGPGEAHSITFISGAI